MTLVKNSDRIKIRIYRMLASSQSEAVLRIIVWVRPQDIAGGLMTNNRVSRPVRTSQVDIK